MDKREKALNGLECLSDENNICSKNTCPYNMFESCVPEITHDALELLKEQPQWIGVEDKLPDKSNRYLVYFGKGIGTTMKTAYWLRTKQKWMGSEAHSTITDITHWMPLPEPPKEVKTDA